MKMAHVSQLIQELGGTGRTHGCIVDIDPLCHVFIHPKTLELTWYYAESMVDKVVCHDPRYLLANAYLRADGKAELMTTSSLFPTGPISEEVTPVYDTSMYTMSNRIKSLQDIAEEHVIKRWDKDVEELILSFTDKIEE